jgi:hypothetical protein
MSPRVFHNNNGKLEDRSESSGLTAFSGWWNCIQSGDFNGDGRIDFIAGNHGLNSRFRASKTEPVMMHINDFDQNGTVEQIISTFIAGKSYPMVLRHDLVSQIPSLKKKYLKYENYKGQTITDIFAPQQMERAVQVQASWLSSSLWLNRGDGTFEVRALPVEAQFSPMFGIAVDDFDNDGHSDVLMAGNLYRVKPEVGRYDADYGVWLRGDGKGGFKAVRALESGFRTDGEMRDLVLLRSNKQSIVLAACNDGRVQGFRYSGQKLTNLR